MSSLDYLLLRLLVKQSLLINKPVIGPPLCLDLEFKLKLLSELEFDRLIVKDQLNPIEVDVVSRRAGALNIEPLIVNSKFIDPALLLLTLP